MRPPSRRGYALALSLLCVVRQGGDPPPDLMEAPAVGGAAAAGELLSLVDDLTERS